MFGILRKNNKNEKEESLKVKEDIINNNNDDKIIRKRFIWNPNINNRDITVIANNVLAREINNEIEPLDADIWSLRVGYICEAIDNIMKKNTTKYCEDAEKIKIILNPIVEKDSHKKDNNEDKKNEDDNGEVIFIREPRWNFEDIYICEKTKLAIDRSLLIANNKDKLFAQWKLGNGDIGRAIVFNFYGPSGTGKSMTAEAIAGYLNKKVYNVNYAELESKYVGETPKNIRKVFEKAQKDDAVLIFDEADSFLGKRLKNVTQSSDYGVNITRSVMLMELEKYSGIVIFTTNLISNYDDAFKRRILANIKFDLPDECGRKKIWDIYINRGIPIESNINSTMLSQKYVNISGADIKDMLLYAAVSAIQKNEHKSIISWNELEEAYKMIASRNVGEDKTIHYKIEQESISEEQYLREISSKGNSDN